MRMGYTGVGTPPDITSPWIHDALIWPHQVVLIITSGVCSGVKRTSLSAAYSIIPSHRASHIIDRVLTYGKVGKVNPMYVMVMYSG